MADYEESLKNILNIYVNEVNLLQEEEKITDESTIKNYLTRNVIHNITLLLEEIEDGKPKNGILDELCSKEKFQIQAKNCNGLREEIISITETLAQEKCKCRDLKFSLSEKSEALNKCINAQVQADVQFNDNRMNLIYKRYKNLNKITEENKCIIEMGREVENIMNSKEEMKHCWEESVLIYIKNKMESIERELRALNESPQNSKLNLTSFVFLFDTVQDVNEKMSNREFKRHLKMLRKLLQMCIGEINILSKLKAQLKEELEKTKLVCITTLRLKEEKSQSAVRKIKLDLADILGDRDHKFHTIESNYKESLTKIEKLKIVNKEKQRVEREYQEELVRIKYENKELQARVEEAHERLAESAVKIVELGTANLELQKRLKITESSFNEADLHQKLNNAEIPNIHVEENKNHTPCSEEQSKYEIIKREAVALSQKFEREKLLNEKLRQRNRELEERQKIFESDTKNLVRGNGQINQDMTEEHINPTRNSREDNRCENESQESETVPTQNIQEFKRREKILMKENMLLANMLRMYKDRCDLLTKKLMTSSKEKYRNNVEDHTVTDNQALNQRERKRAEEHMNNRHPSVTDRKPFIQRERRLAEEHITKRDPSVTDNQPFIQNKRKLSEEHMTKRDPSVTDKEPFIKRERKLAEEHMSKRDPTVTYTQPFIQRERRLAEEQMKKHKQSLESPTLKQTTGKSSRKEPKEVVRRPRWK